MKASDSEIVGFLRSLDPPCIIIPDCDLEQFEKIISVNSRFLRMSLIKGQLEIMPPLPVHIEYSAEIIDQVDRWCEDNKNLVGIPSSSQGGFRLLKLEDPNYPNKHTVLSPNCAIVLKARWDSLTDEAKKTSFPTVAPNFIIELRSQYDSAQLLHEKMVQWVNAGVDEAIYIDLNIDPSEVRIYSFNPDANKVVWQTKEDPVEVKSQVLEGFVLNMQDVRMYKD
ncbi:restriction endonuclease type II-like protein [Gigaspora rosea]|uniref:Restriction endonuclease type II-like protein n=1 Tax=Gigaspora rosea TaxID=44941 RepID=A0A397U2J6_9GLOM|nr:restriction endonuclease type II-like protein [Gigaspora rosea]